MSCKVCGKPSGKYLICLDCLNTKDEQKIVKNELGDNFNSDNLRVEKKCIVCGKVSLYDLCMDCFLKKNYIKKELIASVDNYDDLKKYYKNNKYNILKLRNDNYLINGCCKLIAIWEIIEEKFKLDGFSIKAKKDLIILLDKKKKYLESKNKEKDDKEEVIETDDCNVFWQDYRKIFPMNIRCKDGHYVRSRAEKIIDDYLFENEIMHIYEQRVVNEFNDETYYPDFYLPFLGRTVGDAKGVYIEFFGMENDKKYVDNEKKKLAYYKSKDYDVIEVRDNNINCIDDYLDDELRKIKRKY